MARIIDLFAGPGGWDEGLRALDQHEDCLGVEWDDAACKTAEAAGHKRLQSDIAALDPLEFGDVEGLIASPPCQSYSTAGKQKGRADRIHVENCALEIAAGFDSRWQYEHLLEDQRSLLTVEPLRWALALRPEWIAFEQVPAVLPLWSLFAQILGTLGYSTDVGVLTAEQYGVPQTRKRAYLVASRVGDASLPAPTHTKYRKGKPKQEGDLLPWVSMAEALGWTETGAVYGINTGRDWKKGGSREDAQVIPGDQPAPTLTAKSGGQWQMVPEGVVLRTNNFSAVSRDEDGARSSAGSVPYERSVDDPSPTVTGAASQWTLRQNARANGTASRADEPAPTITAGHDHGDRQWCFERPATAVCCDPRLSPPGYRGGPGDYDADGNYVGERSMDKAVKITPEEASILMGFRGDYPWQGSKTKKFQQIGNAVCPPMGRAVLGAAMGVPA